MGELRIATIPDNASAASGLSARVEALLREDPEVLAAASAISILPTDVLAGLHLLAAEVEGSVLEIGPYQGGSTAAIASGLPAATRIVTVEVGGGNPTHGDLPTDDTLVSLAANLERLGLVQRVDVVQGWSHALTTRRLVADHLRESGIGLLVIDADLDLDDELGAAAHWMRERCLLVINHYLLKAADGVHDGFRASLDNKVAAGVLRRFAVLGGGTWFGQVNGPAAVATLRAGHRLFRGEEGECHSCFLELPVQPDDTSRRWRRPSSYSRANGRSARRTLPTTPSGSSGAVGSRIGPHPPRLPFPGTSRLGSTSRLQTTPTRAPTVGSTGRVRVTAGSSWTSSRRANHQTSLLSIRCRPNLTAKPAPAEPVKRLEWTPELVNRFWDGVAQTRLDELSFGRVAGPVFLDLVAKFLYPEGRHLDYGAGSGHIIQLMADRGYRTAGFDPSPDRQSALMRRVGNHRNFLGLVGPGLRRDVRRRTSRGGYRALAGTRPTPCAPSRKSFPAGRGRVIISTPNSENLELASVYCAVSNMLFHPWQHIRSFTPAKLEELLGEFGFKRIYLGLADFSDDAAVYEASKTTAARERLIRDYLKDHPAQAARLTDELAGKRRLVELALREKIEQAIDAISLKRRRGIAAKLQLLRDYRRVHSEVVELLSSLAGLYVDLEHQMEHTLRLIQPERQPTPPWIAPDLGGPHYDLRHGRETTIVFVGEKIDT